MWRKCFGSLVACALLTGAGVRGNVVFSDGFDYPDGPLVEVSAGKWKTHSGTAGQLQVIDGEIHLSQKESEDVNAAFPGGAIGPLNALTLYAGFKINFSSLPTGVNGSYFAHFKDGAATTGIRCRVFATTNGASVGTFRLGIASGTNVATSPLTGELNTHMAYRVVCRMNLGNNVSTLWVDPHRETDASVTSTDEAAPKMVVGIAFRESLASGAGMGELTVDDVIVATTFLEVLPTRAPVIRSDLRDQTVPAGSEVIFLIEADGTEPFVYRWYFNGTELPEAFDPMLVLREVSSDNAGEYQVTVSNPAGLARSAVALLTVDATSLFVTICRPSHEEPRLTLTWPASPDQAYSVWAADLLGGPFSILGMDLFFPDGLGVFEETLSEAPMRFYRICSP